MYKKIIAILLLLTDCQTVVARDYEIIEQDNVIYAFFQANAKEVSLHWKNAEQQPYQSLDALKKALEPQRKVKMIMNAGIYSKNNEPAGLWIERGKVLHSLNVKSGKGNFHIQPNGVFLIEQQKAMILTTENYRKRKLKPTFAMQSGPMLVINGKMNRQFSAASQSYYKRNAVCVTQDNKLYFFMTIKGQPNLYQLSQALLAKHCRNALYLDGSISNWYIPNQFNTFHWIPFVGMIAVTEAKQDE